MKSLTHLILFSATFTLVGCQGGSGGPQGDLCTRAGFRCDTAACTQFPTTPGCRDVAPTRSYCPIERPRCFDPTVVNGYCDPAISVCARQKAMPPGACPQRLCDRADVEVCNDTSDEPFCRDGFRCARFAQCGADGGADGGAGDGGDADAAVSGDAGGAVDGGLDQLPRD